MTKHTLLLLLCLYSLLSNAQSGVQPFASLTPDAKVSSAHFEVWHREGRKATAMEVARMAEVARGELAYLFDYQPKSVYSLVYWDHLDEWRHSADAFPTLNPNLRNGIIVLPKLHEAVIMPANPADLFAVVKEKTALLMLRELDYGQDLPSIIQNEVLEYKAPWFYEGLARYVARGWTFEDEAVLVSLRDKAWTQLAIEGEGEASAVLRASVWHYLAEAYGPQKFTELMYLAKITHSVEGAVVSILGIPLQTLTRRWQDYLQKHIAEIEKYHVSAAELPNATPIPPPKQQQTGSFAYHEANQLLAAWLCQKGMAHLYVYDLRAASWTKTNIQTGFRQEREQDYRPHYPLCFSADGKFIYTVLPSLADKPGLTVQVWDLATQTSKKYNLPPDFQHIQSWAMDYEGAAFVMSAVVNGRSDLWTCRADFTDFKALTIDGFVDISPVFSWDGQTVLFSSNRNHNSLKAAAPLLQDKYTDFDLYGLNLHPKTDSLERISRTPGVNERDIFLPNSYEIVCRSDASGIDNLHIFNRFQAETASRTAFASGVAAWAGGIEKIVYAPYLSSHDQLYIATFPTQNLIRLQPTRQRISEWLFLKQTGRYPAFATTDSASYPQRAYIYADKQPDNYNVNSPEEDKALKRNLVLAESVVVEEGDAQTPWQANFMRAEVVYDPVARGGVVLGTAFSDLHQRHLLAVTATPYFMMLPFVQFHNADAGLLYAFLPKRTDLYAEMGGSRRIWTREGLVNSNRLDTAHYRFSRLYLKAGAIYPLSAYAFVGVEQQFDGLAKRDLRFLVGPQLKDENAVYALTSLFGQYEKMTCSEDYISKGIKFRADFQRFTPLTAKKTAFQTLTFNAQCVQPIWKKIVLAGNLHGGYSFGRSPQQFYLGGANNWFLGILRMDRFGSSGYTGILNTDLAAFSYQQFVPVRGFGFNSRRGSRYLSTNWELRVPVTRYARNRLNDKNLYIWEWLGFVDFGWMWKGNYAFSWTANSEPQTVVVPPVSIQYQSLRSPYLWSIGTGAKARMLNYTLRLEAALGRDSGRWRAPILVVSMGRAF